MLACGVTLLAACERSPTAPGPQAGTPQASDGRRTSVPGRAMDRAEDLKKEVDAYNKAIEETIEQGTSPAASRPKTAGASPPSR
jgi:hypothetical protein